MADARSDDDDELVEDQGEEAHDGQENDDNEEVTEDDGTDEEGLEIVQDQESSDDDEEVTEDDGTDEEADDSDDAEEEPEVFPNADFVLRQEPGFLRTVDEVAAVGRSHESGEAVVAEVDEAVDFFESRGVDSSDLKPKVVLLIFDLHMMCLSNAHAEKYFFALRANAANITTIRVETLWGNMMPEAPPSRRARLAMARRLAAVLKEACSALATIVIDAIDIARVPVDQRDFVVQVIDIILEAWDQAAEVVLAFESVEEGEHLVLKHIARAIARRPSIERLKVGCMDSLVVWRLVCRQVVRMRGLAMFSMERGKTFNRFPHEPLISISTDRDAELLCRLLTMRTMREIAISRLAFSGPAVERLCAVLRVVNLRRLLVCSSTILVALQPAVATALGTASLERLWIDSCAGVPSADFFETLGAGLSRNDVVRGLRLSARDYGDA